MSTTFVASLALGLATSGTLFHTAAALPVGASQQEVQQVPYNPQERGSRSTTTCQQLMQSLLAYGQWFSHPQFGWVWQPHDVQPWWQPFSVGEWIITQNGTPYWRSGLPFGWAAEHYGSWTFDQDRGWLWVPGNDWSAAPVSWRATNGVVGWAPQIATLGNTQSGPCPQPPWAWIFVPSNRVMMTSNFSVAEQELMSRDLHGTWGSWAHQPDGATAHRIPEPRNANLLEATQCLGPADVNGLLASLAADRGRTAKGPPITWVTTRSQMGSGRVTNGVLYVYAPFIDGTPPAPGSRFLVNPPAQPVQRAMPIARSAPIPRAQSVNRATSAPTLTPVQPAPSALPNPAAVPASPATPLNPYDAFTYQQESLDEYHASQYDALRQLHSSDASKPPIAGMTPAQLAAWQKKEQREMQRMAARQRRLLDAKQSQVNESEETGSSGAAAGSSGAAAGSSGAAAPTK